MQDHENVTVNVAAAGTWKMSRMQDHVKCDNYCSGMTVMETPRTARTVVTMTVVTAGTTIAVTMTAVTATAGTAMMVTAESEHVKWRDLNWC